MRYSLFLSILILFCFTHVSAQRRATGALINKETIAKTPQKVQLSFRSFRGMPESFSLEQYCPTPGDQGNHGTCVAFANGYGLATLLYAKAHGIKDKSLIDKYIFSPTFLYEQIKSQGDNECQNGSDPITAVYNLIDNGDALLRTVPYNCGVTISQEAKTEASQYKLSDIAIVFAAKDMLTTDQYVVTPEGQIQNTKKALLEGTPVSTAFYLPESFFHIKSAIWTTTPADTLSDWKHSGHAMLVVGYDDNIAGGAFRVMNSWGTDWADHGFIWIKYKDFTQWCVLGVQAFPDMQTPAPPELNVIPEPKPEPKPEPQPEPQPAPPPAPTPNNVVDNFSMSGSVEFKMNDGTDMPVSKVSTRNLVVEEEASSKEDLVAYTMQNGYHSGDKFRFYINIDKEAYIYAFATDLSGKVNRILPYDDMISTHVGANSIVAFPSDTKIVKLDENKGTDYMLILFSTEKLNSADIATAMSNASGGLSAKIKAALGDKLIDKSNIKYNDMNVGFNYSSDQGGVIPLMVEIKHQ